MLITKKELQALIATVGKGHLSDIGYGADKSGMPMLCATNGKAAVIIGEICRPDKVFAIADIRAIVKVMTAKEHAILDGDTLKCNLMSISCKTGNYPDVSLANHGFDLEMPENVREFAIGPEAMKTVNAFVTTFGIVNWEMKTATRPMKLTPQDSDRKAVALVMPCLVAN